MFIHNATQMINEIYRDQDFICKNDSPEISFDQS